MVDFSVVPVDHQPDFSEMSLVPVDHDPFSEDGMVHERWMQPESQSATRAVPSRHFVNEGRGGTEAGVRPEKVVSPERK